MTPADPFLVAEAPRLSRRQLQVLQLLAEGMQAKAIAPALGIHIGVVKVHSTVARRKLGARNNVHAVALAVRAGLI